MTPSRVVRLLSSSAAIAGLLATAAPDSVAQNGGRQAPFAPARLWDGKTPDFRGIWQARGTAYVNVEGHPGGKGLAASRSIVVDPPDGKIPYRRDALTRRQANYRNRDTADPSLFGAEGKRVQVRRAQVQCRVAAKSRRRRERQRAEASGRFWRRCPHHWRTGLAERLEA